MPLVANTTAEELYRLLAEMHVDTEAVKRAKTSYDELVKMYLYLLDVELIRFRHEKIVVLKERVY